MKQGNFDNASTSGGASTSADKLADMRAKHKQCINAIRKTPPSSRRDLFSDMGNEPRSIGNLAQLASVREGDDSQEDDDSAQQSTDIIGTPGKNVERQSSTPTASSELKPVVRQSSAASTGSVEGDDKTLTEIRKKHMQCISAIRTGSRTPPNTRKAEAYPGLSNDSTLRGLFDRQADGSQDGDAMSERTTMSVLEDPVVKAMHSAQKWLESEANQMMSCVEELYQDTARDMKDLWRSLQGMNQKLEALQEQDTQLGLRALKESVETCARMSSLRVQGISAALETLKEAVALQARGVEDIKALGGPAGTSAVTRDVLEDQVKGFANLAKNLEPVQNMKKDVDDQVGVLENLISKSKFLHHQGHQDKLRQLQTSLDVHEKYSTLQAQVDVAKQREAIEIDAHQRLEETNKQHRGLLEQQVKGNVKRRTSKAVSKPDKKRMALSFATGAAIAAVFRVVFCSVLPVVAKPMGSTGPVPSVGVLRARPWRPPFRLVIARSKQRKLHT